ncbi:MAG: EAL domain-containing protein [Phenylobacterium sp.]|uniref:EAL domain-containing protein n=1 Tax=Phenylobacterium sp. TaxID=1871053 RepID=UPI00271FBC69|nr:EAL domain-containing protein [Phenylobacterium sp.]MDO8912965.1 EAL domain-containing protein [Phenylobacterium sp.]MDP2009107.1 EAL domain-containing protein [Phenylobacterium sp.]MDP3099284.1 EAL domain-containing protein [Phenylobacterium sp.]MDP3868768.1 EAL domain-containing protein [Phenylobacterium sp.]HQT52158.1 EAL domain-containing protein [Phenylobacterium sp.]
MSRPPPCAGCRDGEAVDFDIAMAFQPIMDLQTGAPFAYEALVRGSNGESAASVLAQVTPENRYAFDQQCRVKAIQGAARAGLLDGPARLSINFLPNAVYSPQACIQLTLATAAALDFPTDRLIFEFTENEEMTDPAHVSNIVASYQKMGFGVALDDFGAGHAGLNLLARFQPDLIKLDMELIRGLDASLPRRIIIDGVMKMCAALGVEVIAEGIETRAELDALREIGVRYIQGYLFAKPGFQSLPAVNPIDVRAARAA